MADLPNPNPSGTASVAMMQLSFQETSTNYLQGIYEEMVSLKNLLSSILVVNTGQLDSDKAADQKKKIDAAKERDEDAETKRESRFGIAGGASIGGLGRYADYKTGGKVGRFFIPEHGLEDEYLSMKGMNRKDANVISKKFNNIVGKIQDEDEETRELIYKLLVRDESVMREGVDSRVLDMTDEARDVMSKYGKDLVDLGVLKENTWLKNHDSYIHRIYKNPDFYKQKQIIMKL